MIDIGNLYGVAISGTAHSHQAALDRPLFTEFLNSFARLKYPASTDFTTQLLDELTSAKSVKIMETPFMNKAFERHAIRVLTKFDLPLRRAFCNFAGSGANIGVGVTWEEVKRLDMGMEIDGFTSFCAATSLIPDPLSTENCKTFAKEVLNLYPCLSGSKVQNSVVMYPHFQMLLCRLAAEMALYQSAQAEEAQKLAEADTVKRFAKKVVNEDSKPLANLLQELLRSMGIDKLGPSSSFQSFQEGGKVGDLDLETYGFGTLGFAGDESDVMDTRHVRTGEVAAPGSTRAEDQYTAFLNQGRHTMALRMEHLLDQAESRLMVKIGTDDGIVALINSTHREHVENMHRSAGPSMKYASKPVVIGDALPVPNECPEDIEQLLEAALAHHNLGSYEESLKFLEAARLQIEEVQIEKKRDEILTAHEAAAEKAAAEGTDTGTTTDAAVPNVDEMDLEVKLPLDMEMYIVLCKGNVYQSSGDDENAMQQYLNAWVRAEQDSNEEWQVVAINSIGMLAYYSLRYEVALMSFYRVTSYRSDIYGTDSADTCTAVNNEGCALFAMGNRSAARIRFERAWNGMCKSLGHRHPRCVATWKNLERGKRAQATLRRSDLDESIALRPDADKLLMNGEYTIKALPPPVEGGGKKKKGGGKKKKK